MKCAEYLEEIEPTIQESIAGLNVEMLFKIWMKLETCEDYRQSWGSQLSMLLGGYYVTLGITDPTKRADIVAKLKNPQKGRIDIADVSREELQGIIRLCKVFHRIVEEATILEKEKIRKYFQDHPGQPPYSGIGDGYGNGFVFVSGNIEHQLVEHRAQSIQLKPPRYRSKP